MPAPVPWTGRCATAPACTLTTGRIASPADDDVEKGIPETTVLTTASAEASVFDADNTNA
jgi:hypothetical protein